MHRFFVAALASAILALPVLAQQGGSANRATPTLGQSITFVNGCAVDIKYRAITWAQGRFMEALKTPEGRDRHNKGLKNNPTGSLTSSQDITLGGQTVKAGTYKLYFQVDADVKFHLVLADDAGTETKWKLDLTEGTDMNTRLSLSLTAGKGDNDANIKIAFGKQSGNVALVSGADAAKKEMPKDAAAPAKTDKGDGKQQA
jgi:hypothetical protein